MYIPFRISKSISDQVKFIYYGGSGEIRTHGPFRAVCFQDRCNKPDSATLP